MLFVPVNFIKRLTTKSNDLCRSILYVNFYGEIAPFSNDFMHLCCPRI